MSQHKYAEIADTVYFWFAVNTTAGEADDGATPTYVVRLAGAASDAAPTEGPTAATLLSEGTYYAGLHEIAYDTTGDAAGEYAVFCTAVVSAVNPAGFCGSYTLRTAGTSALDVNPVGAVTLTSLSVTGQMDAGNVLVDSTAVITTDATISGDLLITGTTTLTGNVALSGTLGIAGATTLASLSITGQLDAANVLIDSTLVITTDATISGDLLVTGTTTHTGNTSYGGTYDVVGAVTAGSVSIDAGFDIVGALSANSLLIDTTTALTGAVTAPAGIAANITGDITGNLSGTTGEVASVAGDVKGNVDGSVATCAAATVSAIDNIDFGATMKASITAAVWDFGSAITTDFGTLLERVYQLLSNEMNVTDADGSAALRNVADDANIATGSITDAAGTTSRAGWTWL